MLHIGFGPRSLVQFKKGRISESDDLKLTIIECSLQGIDGFVISSGRDMHIESNARRTGKVNSLTLSDGSFDVRGNLFAVHSTYSNEDVIFQAGIEEVLISASDVPIAASAGFTLQGSLISNTIRGDPNHDFR